jgi:hypothetical protein
MFVICIFMVIKVLIIWVCGPAICKYSVNLAWTLACADCKRSEQRRKNRLLQFEQTFQNPVQVHSFTRLDNQFRFPLKSQTTIEPTKIRFRLWTWAVAALTWAGPWVLSTLVSQLDYAQGVLFWFPRESVILSVLSIIRILRWPFSLPCYTYQRSLPEPS